MVKNRGSERGWWRGREGNRGEKKEWEEERQRQIKKNRESKRERERKRDKDRERERRRAKIIKLKQGRIGRKKRSRNQDFRKLGYNYFAKIVILIVTDFCLYYLFVYFYIRYFFDLLLYMIVSLFRLLKKWGEREWNSTISVYYFTAWTG